jgi:hypothetical protein
MTGLLLLAAARRETGLHCTCTNDSTATAQQQQRRQTEATRGKRNLHPSRLWLRFLAPSLLLVARPFAFRTDGGLAASCSARLSLPSRGVRLSIDRLWGGCD